MNVTVTTSESSVKRFGSVLSLGTRLLLLQCFLHFSDCVFENRTNLIFKILQCVFSMVSYHVLLCVNIISIYSYFQAHLSLAVSECTV